MATVGVWVTGRDVNQYYREVILPDGRLGGIGPSGDLVGPDGHRLADKGTILGSYNGSPAVVGSAYWGTWPGASTGVPAAGGTGGGAATGGGSTTGGGGGGGGGGASTGGGAATPTGATGGLDLAALARNPLVIGVVGLYLAAQLGLLNTGGRRR